MAVKTYAVECPNCKRDVDFCINDVPELDAHIDDVVREAENDTRSEVEAEFEHYFDPEVLINGDRPFWEMSAALRRGDIREAELQLHRLAAACGSRAQEEVQQARFSPRARAA